MAADAEQIGLEQACRALIISASPCGDGETKPPKAWITAHCRLGGQGGGQVCCEQIAFELCARDNDQLRNLVFAHLDSDLPLIFWWRGELSESFEPRLHSRFDRLIIDSDKFVDPAADIARATSPDDYVLHDLAWSRSHPLRIAIADCFEAPAAREALNDIGTVEITPAPEHKQTAALLASWFANALGWDAAKRDATVQFTESPGVAVSEVLIDATGRRFEITADANHVRANSSLPGREYSQLLPINTAGDAQTVTALLARGGDNDLYLSIARL
jgi:glucose-6-phosphate dehydrogenase assembly protein OpcA